MDRREGKKKLRKGGIGPTEDRRCYRVEAAVGALGMKEALRLQRVRVARENREEAKRRAAQGKAA